MTTNLTELCNKYRVPIAEVLELLKALGKVSPKEAERILWMATGAAFAASAREGKI